MLSRPVVLILTKFFFKIFRWQLTMDVKAAPDSEGGEAPKNEKSEGDDNRDVGKGAGNSTVIVSSEAGEGSSSTDNDKDEKSSRKDKSDDNDGNKNEASTSSSEQTEKESCK